MARCADGLVGEPASLRTTNELGVVRRARVSMKSADD